MTRPLLLLLLTLAPAPAAEPWSTYRGNPERTGNTDGLAAPAGAKVLWAYKTQSHFIAAPVPFGERLFVSGLGAFNKPDLFALPLVPAGAPEPAWSKSSPLIKLPSVSSPALAGGALVFGDGMHQTDGAVLYALAQSDGMPLWRLDIPGDLVHLEGAPAVVGTRAYFGAGAAGVLCVDFATLSLDGREVAVKELPALQASRWKALEAKYADDKKRDPEFAVPPGEDQLLKATPKVAWHEGQTAWHVDAPVNVVGERVLVCSAYLEKEKVGERSLFCLKAATGEKLWTAKPAINPWGGASAIDDVAVTTGSSIPYDPKLLKGAKGEVAAFELATGRERWRKELPGGVLGCAALTKDLALFTCTDGKLRGFSLKDGERRLVYDAKAPLFGPPAVVGDVAYVADLRGVVHAVDIKTQAAQWTLDLGADPAVKSPGMVYGGVTVHGGRLYVATCNLDGPNARKPTAVVCIGK